MRQSGGEAISIIHPISGSGARDRGRAARRFGCKVLCVWMKSDAPRRRAGWQCCALCGGPGARESWGCRERCPEGAPCSHQGRGCMVRCGITWQAFLRQRQWERVAAPGSEAWGLYGNSARCKIKVFPHKAKLPATGYMLCMEWRPSNSQSNCAQGAFDGQVELLVSKERCRNVRQWRQNVRY